MIRAFNKFGESFLGKVVIVLLVLSFITLFGTGSISNLFNIGNKPVITIGDREILGTELVDEFQKEKAKVSRFFPGGLSNEDAIRYGILRDTVNNLIYATVIEEIGKKARIDLSDDMVIEYIRTIPDFMDETGNFKRSLFLQTLAQSGYTERAFIDNARSDLQEAYIMDSARAFPMAPKVMLGLYEKHKSYTRDALVVNLNYADMKIEQPASDDELRDFYDENIANYMIPEMRDLVVATINYKDMTDRVKVSEEEIRQLFEEEKDVLSDPELRRVYWLVFEAGEKDKADDAFKRLQDGQSFKSVAAGTRSISEEEDYDMGFISRDSVIEAIGEPVFDAKAGDNIGPVKAGEKFVVLKVVSVTPYKEAKYSDKKKALQERIAREKVDAQISEMSLNMEDDIGSGMSLKEVADKYKLSLSNYKKVKEGDKSPDERIINYAFSLEEKEVSPVMDMDGGMFIVESEKVYEKEAKAFSSVKVEVKKDWETLQKEQIAQGLAQEIMVRVNSPEIENKALLANIAKEKGLPVKTLKGVAFGADSKDLDKREVSQLFNLRLGEASINPLADGYRIVGLQAVNPNKKAYDAEAKSKHKTDIEDQLVKSFEQQFYMDYLKELNVKTNEAAIAELFKSLLGSSEDY